MTKNVRIENADTSTFKVVVDVQERKWDFDLNKLQDEWTTVETVTLSYPTQMTEKFLTSTRRFIIREE